MSVHQVFELARAAGLALFVDEDGLVVEGSGPPPDEVVDLLRRHKADLIALLSRVPSSWTAEDWQAFFDERAGIVEFDGGATRIDAEAQAYRCCVIEWLRQNPIEAPLGSCASCGSGERSGALVVPLGTVSTPRDWIHPLCWPEWNAKREAEAVAALAGFGIHSSRDGGGR